MSKVKELEYGVYRKQDKEYYLVEDKDIFEGNLVYIRHFLGFNSYTVRENKGLLYADNESLTIGLKKEVNYWRPSWIMDNRAALKCEF